MATHKIKIYFVFILSTFLIHCTKEVIKEDIVANSNPFTISDLGALVINDLGKLPSGNYYLPYYKYNSVGKYDLGMGIFDRNGILRSNNVYESSKDVFSYNSTCDNEGNIYIVGSTSSLELKADTSSASTTTDAYLAKFNSQGSLLWQFGYSNIFSGNNGKKAEYFNSVYIIDNKIYCVGLTQNHTVQSLVSNWQDYENWVVVFDLNGNYLYEDRFSNIFYQYPPGLFRNGSLLLQNGDILSYWFQLGANNGTTVCLSRYSPTSRNEEWRKYYYGNTVEGQMIQLCEANDGNLWALNSTYSKKIKLDGTTGDVLKIEDSNLLAPNKTGNMQVYRVQRINNAFYLTGSISKGFIQIVGLNGGSAYSTDARPWLVKLDQDLNIVFNKTYDMPGGSFLNLLENSNGNLQIVLSLEKFETNKYSTGLVATDLDGNLITP